MSFALTSFKKDIARWRQDYMATLIWLAIPLLTGGLITTLMSSDVKPHGTLLLVDEDQTFLVSNASTTEGRAGYWSYRRALHRHYSSRSPSR